MLFFACNDVFCRICLKDYFSLLIKEGLVRLVSCPGLACVQKRKEVDSGATGVVAREQLLEIVGEDLTKRWEWLLEKNRVESGTWTLRCQSQ